MPDTLAEEARRRSQRCLEAVRQAVSDTVQRGDVVTVQGIAREAGVSRNFIYATREARNLVESFRSDAAHPSKSKRRRTASEETLLARLATALSTIDELTQEIESLRARNAVLVAEVVALQNPAPANVTPLKRRRM